jgi:hypothetical protein
LRVICSGSETATDGSLKPLQMTFSVVVRADTEGAALAKEGFKEMSSKGGQTRKEQLGEEGYKEKGSRLGRVGAQGAARPLGVQLDGEEGWADHQGVYRLGARMPSDRA